MPTVPLARLCGLPRGSLLKAPGGPGPVTPTSHPGCSAGAGVSAGMGAQGGGRQHLWSLLEADV